MNNVLAGVRSRGQVLGEPNVAKLATATFFNAAGNNVYSIALGWLAYELTQSPLVVGTVLGLRTLPIVFVGILSGAVVDRMHRPTVLRLYALWYTALSFAFTGLLYLGDVGVGHMLTYMFLVGLGFTFGPSARRAIYADSVPRRRVVDALAVDRTTFELGHMSMPAIIGIILAAYGAGVAFSVQCVLYALMTVLAFTVNTPRKPASTQARPPFLQSVGEGLSYARRQPGVLRMLGVSTSLALFGGSFAYALVPVVSIGVLDAGATGIGVIMAGGAAGGLFGPILLLLLRGRVESPWVLGGSALLMCLGLAAFAFAPVLVLAVVAYGIVGAAQPVQGAMSDGYMQLAVESEFRGRVGSLAQVTRGISSLSAFLAGATAEFLGVQAALVAAAAIVAAIGVWAALVFRKYGVDGW